MNWHEYCIDIYVAISINDYQTSPFFDEYLNSAKSFRPHTKKIGQYLTSLKNKDLNEINKICKVVEEETGQVISPANINSPNQVVIAGSDEAAIIAADKCKEAGAKRCIQLIVSVASHCNLMDEAASNFKKELDEYAFNTPDISIIHNVDAKIEEDIAKIPKKLIEQLTLPVQWTKTMEYIKSFDGVVIECGPGKVLSGLAKTNGLDNILSMSSETFEDDLKGLL